MRLWYCADGRYAEVEENDTCQVHIAGGEPCGWMLLVAVDALVIDKVDGAWAGWATEKWWRDGMMPVDYFDDLAAVQEHP